MSPRYIEPVVDRTAADILAKNAKAYLNVADWLRIYGNSQQLNSLAVIITGSSISFITISEPTIASVVDVDDVNSLVANIESVRTLFTVPESLGLDELKTDWQSGNVSDSPDYEDVNTWELAIMILMGLVAATADYQVYCGVATAGQIRFYQNRWRSFPDWVPAEESPARSARCGIAMSGSGLNRNNYFRRYA